MGFFDFGSDSYCLRNDIDGTSQIFHTPEDAAQYARMYDGHVHDAGGTETLKRLREMGYDSHGERTGSTGGLLDFLWQ